MNKGRSFLVGIFSVLPIYILYWYFEIPGGEEKINTQLVEERSFCSNKYGVSVFLKRKSNTKSADILSKEYRIKDKQRNIELVFGLDVDSDLLQSREIGWDNESLVFYTPGDDSTDFKLELECFSLKKGSEGDTNN